MSGFLQKLGLLCLLVFAPYAAAEPVVSLGTLSETEPLLVGRYVSFWETGHDTAPEEIVVQGQMDAQFVPSTQELPGRGLIAGVIWIRLLVDNPAAESAEIYLNSRYPLLDEVTLFQRGPGGTIIRDSQGDSTPSRTGLADYRVPSFKLKAAPGRNVYYIKMKTEGSSIVALYLMRPEAQRHYQIFDMGVLFLFLGVILTLFFYNIFLTISLRSITYLYYSIFLVCMLVVQLSLQGIWPMILPGPLGAWAQNTGFLLSACMVFFFGSMVSLHFLNMKEHMPNWRIFFIVFQLISVLLFVAAFVFPYSQYVKVMSASFLIGSIAQLVSSVQAVLRGYRPAFAYSFAWFFMIVTNILLYLTFEGQSHIPMIVQWGNMPGVIGEGILMSLALGDRMNYFRAKADRTIHQLNEELQNHLVQVEALVTERTETIRTIIDNVASGFLMIDKEAILAPGFTRSCQGLLGSELAEGQNLIQLLKMKTAAEKKFRMALNQIFDDQMPLEVSLAQLPAHMHVNGKYLHIDAAGLRDKQGVLRQLLLTLTDATELRKRKVEAHRNHSLLKILRDIEGFRQFVAYSFEAIQKLKALQKESEGKTAREISFILHTLKGNCLVFHLPHIARVLHGFEEKKQINAQEILDLEELFKKYLTRHASLLRTSWGPATHEKRITARQLESLDDIIQTSNPAQLKFEVEHWIRDMSAKPIRGILQSLINDARVVARKLGKEVEFSVMDRDARIHSEAEELLIDELIHIVRNAIVHGIEEDREAIQKPRQGYIFLDFRELPDGLVISCADDGRGFDRKVWEAEWQKRGLGQGEDISRVPLVELIRRISRGGFSTQEKVSLFAGRGIGIEALFAAVDQCHGSIDVLSEAGKGCRFEIFVPRPLMLRSVS